MWNKKVEGDYGVEREASTGKGEGKPGRAMVGEKTYVACFSHSQTLHIRSMCHENTMGVMCSEENHQQEVRVGGVMGVT